MENKARGGKKRGKWEMKYVNKKVHVHVFHLCSRHILDQTVETIR